MSASRDRRTEELAARASELWATLDGGSMPSGVETLKPAHRKSAVLRLHGAGPDGQAVVAKRAARASIEIEARVYRDVLARLPVSATRLLGTAPEGERAWLFLQDAGDTPFDSKLPGNRRLAAIWMAQVHGGAGRLPQAKGLPARDAEHYRALLRSVEALLGETLDNSALSNEESAVVEETVEACAALESSWAGVAEVLSEAPATIVFGGFSSKNARVRESADGPVLMPYDFESAGYGCPAIDLVFPDPETYVREASAWWDGLDAGEFERVQGVGRVLGGLKAIPGERSVLLGESPAKAVAKLRWYGNEVAGGMSAAGVR